MSPFKSRTTESKRKDISSLSPRTVNVAFECCAAGRVDRGHRALRSIAKAGECTRVSFYSVSIDGREESGWQCDDGCFFGRLFGAC